MEDIKYRAYRFAVDVIKFLRKQDWKNRVNEPIFKQLIRSSTSIGANIVEGRSGNSVREMVQYYRIALKSANESKYWLSLLRDALEMRDERIEMLTREAIEISKIIAASVISLLKKLKSK